MKTFHLIMPSSMVTPLLLHMFHRTAVGSDMKLWLYGNDGNDDASLLEKYLNLNKILNQYMAGEVIKNFNEIRHIDIPDHIDIESPGIGDAYGIAEQLVKKQLTPIHSEDEVTIIADSNIWLGVALAYKSIIRKAPRVISLASPENATDMANISLLIKEFNNNIRIDLIQKGKCTDILAVARAVEAIEPPDEPNGLYITKEKPTSFYLTDEDLPTPITRISLRTVIQLSANIEYCKKSDTFLRTAKVRNSFRTSEQLGQLEDILNVINNYMKMQEANFKSEYEPVDMSTKLENIEKRKDGYSSGYYNEMALKHIISVSFSIMDKIGEGQGAGEFEIPKIDNRDVNFSECLNPFFAAGATLESFFNTDQHGLELRSRCLDIWEIFMNPCKHESIEIEEIIIKDNIKNWSFYHTLPFSETFFSQNALYKIIYNGKCVAITSPFTGFACCDSALIGPKKELSERTLEFKKFIYDYVMTIPGFSQGFKDYVTNNCTTDELGLSDTNFFSKYNQFSNKIPIY